jgi:hypothetical protein
MDVAVDHLKVRQSPKVDQSRPRRVSVFAPDPEQRDAMVNFGIPPQPPAALSAPPTLETPQKSNLATRRIPELPSDHTSTVPDRILVGTAAPQVNVPAEAIYGAVGELVGIDGGVVSGVINLESSGGEASDWRPRHDERYHET